MKAKPESGAFPRRNERFPDSATLHPGYVPERPRPDFLTDRKGSKAAAQRARRMSVAHASAAGIRYGHTGWPFCFFVGQTYCS
jgi:hypothetical protein